MLLWRDTGGEAVLLRCLAGALVSRDGRSTAALRRSAFWAREGPNGLDSWRKKEKKGC